MSTDFATAMRRSLAQVRAMDVHAATATIQEALSAHAGTPAPQTSQPVPPGSTAPASSEAPETVSTSGRPRRRLDEVVRLLSRRSAGLPGTGEARIRQLAVPEGARFDARSFTCAAGTRRYRLYVPASLNGRPRGVLVMLHGCTQDPEDFAAGTGMHAQAEAHGIVVVWPEQTRNDNPSACWNWFRPGDQRRDAGEPAILAGIARQISEDFGVGAGQTFVAGLSAGGAMAHVLAATYPDVFAAAGVHSGLAHGAAGDVVSAFTAMRGENRSSPGGEILVPLIVFHGAADATVHPTNARQVIGTLAGAATERTVAGGRTCTRTVATGTDGRVARELWLIDGAGHAWSGGLADGSYADPSGPEASAEMIRFFLEQSSRA